jgi:hypothetical protein
MGDFWQNIDTQLDTIQALGIDTFEGIADILPGGNDLSAAPAFFGGSGGDRSLFSALYEAGWIRTWIEADYYYVAWHPTTGSVLTYIEGDIYPGDQRH